MNDFLDDERKRLAYADRAETREAAQRATFLGITGDAGDRLFGEEMRSASPGPAARSLGCTCISLGTGTSEDGVFEMQHADRCPLRDWRINSRRRSLADGTGRHSRKEMERAVEFTGLRCDAHSAPFGTNVQCESRIAGDTSSRDALHRLTARAERLGWQVLHVDGVACHWCPQHRDVDRESIRRLK